MAEQRLPEAKHAAEVARGDRFEFGANWRRFLSVLDEDRIQRAEASFTLVLGERELRGRTFLDIGSGSGLSSLVARRLGARVRSFDYDPASVACTRELRRRYFPDDPDWLVEAGSALDEHYMGSLGAHDIVYSWGVLHHTGDLWRALGLASRRVAPGGTLFIAIYNDQGAWSPRWRRIKQLYCTNAFCRVLVSGVIIPWWILRSFAADVVFRRNPMRRYTEYRRRRGMSVWHDWHDWLGGLPFEFAKPEAVFDFVCARGFELRRFTTVGGSVGCNEFVFARSSEAAPG